MAGEGEISTAAWHTLADSGEEAGPSGTAPTGLSSKTQPDRSPDCCPFLLASSESQGLEFFVQMAAGLLIKLSDTAPKPCLLWFTRLGA